MDINKILYDILHKYELDNEYSEAWNYYEICDYVNSFFDGLDKDVFAVKCGGVHTKRLYETLSPDNRRRIKYVIDDNAADNSGYAQWSIITMDRAKKLGIKKVVISSYDYEAEVFGELLQNDMLGLSVYDYLRQHGYAMYGNFFDYKEKMFTYVDVLRLRKELSETDGSDKRKAVHQRLIFALVMIRDFIGVKNEIECYKACAYNDPTDYSGFVSDLQRLLSDIKEMQKENHNKNIIINWIDALNYEKALEMSIFSEGEGIVFENAYNVIPYTGSVLRSIMSGKYELLEDLSHEFSESNSLLLNNLKVHNYRFMYVANRNMYVSLFPDDMLLSYRSYYPYQVNDPIQQGCSTRLQWEALNILLNSEQPVCMIIHNIMETHLPFLYSDSPSFVLGDIFRNPEWYKDREERSQGGIVFLNKQIEWYRQYYNKDSVEIFMTDHGPTSDNKNYSDVRAHVIVKLTGSGFEGFKSEKRLFSFVNYWKLIIHIWMTSKTL